MVKSILVALIALIVLGGCGKEEELQSRVALLMQANGVLKKENELLKKRQKELSSSDNQKDKVIQKLNEEIDKSQKRISELEKKLVEANYKVDSKHKQQIEKEAVKKYKIYLSFLSMLLIGLIGGGIFLYKKLKNQEELIKDKEAEFKKAIEEKEAEIQKQREELSKAQSKIEKLEQELNTKEENEIVAMIKNSRSLREEAENSIKGGE